MWVLLWLQVISGSFDHYHVGSYSSEKLAKKHKKRQVLVTNQNSKIVCIKIER